jgi:hypothetical protein
VHELGLTVSSARDLHDTAFTRVNSMGFARLAETGIRKATGKGETQTLSAMEKIAASTVGGALATWNQPIEVIRVEVIMAIDLRVCSMLTSLRCNPWQRELLLRIALRSSRS